MMTLSRSKERWLKRADSEPDVPIGAGVPRCPHMNFAAEVDVHRLTESEEPDARVKGFSADIRVRCAECGRPFQFLGLPAGLDTQGIGMSVDGLEAHLALCPQGEQPSPLDRIAVHFPTKRRH